MNGVKKIFCIGLGKTGTKTIADILRRSGRKHSTGPVKKGLFWYRSDQLQEIKRITERFDSFDDYPYPLVFKYLHKVYPDATFILTTRSSPEEWADSVIDHHMRFGPSDAQLMTFGFYPLARDREWLCDFYKWHYQEVVSHFGNRNNFFVVDWTDSSSVDTFLKRIHINTDSDHISPINTRREQDAERVVIKHLANKRPGAALLYAKEHPKKKQLMNKIKRYGDRPLSSKILKALHTQPKR